MKYDRFNALESNPSINRSEFHQIGSCEWLHSHERCVRRVQQEQSEEGSCLRTRTQNVSRWAFISHTPTHLRTYRFSYFWYRNMAIEFQNLYIRIIFFLQKYLRTLGPLKKLEPALTEVSFYLKKNNLKMKKKPFPVFRKGKAACWVSHTLQNH